MMRRPYFILLSLLLIAVPILGGDLPQVVQPNTTGYSATEVAALVREISALEETLNDHSFGSRRSFAPNGWQGRNFAEYTGGVLAERGYPITLASQPGWPDGVHTWALNWRTNGLGPGGSLPGTWEQPAEPRLCPELFRQYRRPVVRGDVS